MKSSPLRFALPLLLLALFPLACSRLADPAYRQKVDAWHAERVERLRSESGWLTLVGLHPLREGANTIGSAEGMDVRLLVARAPARVGTLTVNGDSLALEVAPGAKVRLQSRTEDLAGQRIALATDAGGHPTVIDLGGPLFYVIKRGDRLFVRVKDPNSEARRSFTGIERFPVDPRWRVKAKLEPDVPPRTVSVPDVLGGVSEEPTPGTLVFRLRGRECRLRPTGEPGQPLSFVFGDASNGDATYGGGRFLETEALAADGTVTIDFNRAYNPPCAFTPYATCPLPPEGNKLPFAVEAGEKTYGSGHH
jgi:uncharacterized protein